MKYWTESKKDRIQTIDDIRRRLQADLQAGCEVQVNWSLLGHGDPNYHHLFVILENRKSVVAWNEHKHSAPSQVDGVIMVVTGLISNYAKPNSEVEDSGKDPTGPGRWCSLLVEGTCGPVWLVTKRRRRYPKDYENLRA